MNPTCTLLLHVFILFNIWVKSQCGATLQQIYRYEIQNNADSVFQGSISQAEPKQAWDYVTVRPKAHLFYWLYYTTHSQGYNNRPLILWLQGGPGGSGTGFGNFGELGPLDVNLNPRNTTWLQTASLLFIDNPVGTGYSYAEDESAFTTNVAEISADLLTLMKHFVQTYPDFKRIPFYIFSESYGGKMTAAFSAVLYAEIQKGGIDMNFKGFAMGDSWISPVDSTNSWGPFLYATSIVDIAGLGRINAAAKKAEDLVKEGKFAEATAAWSLTESVVAAESAGVNFYNILEWDSEDSKRFNSVLTSSKDPIERLYEHHVKVMQNDALDELMNGPIRKKLKIIPDKVSWGVVLACNKKSSIHDIMHLGGEGHIFVTRGGGGLSSVTSPKEVRKMATDLVMAIMGQSGTVFDKQAGDFMKNVTSTVNDLVNNSSLKVVIYSGQLDLICDILGTETWFYKNIDKAGAFQKEKKQDFQCGDKPGVCFYLKEYQNLQFYWVLDAGHMVPTDNGPGALAMVNKIINKP